MLLTGNEGLMSKTLGKRSIRVIGAKSLIASYGRLGENAGLATWDDCEVTTSV